MQHTSGLPQRIALGNVLGTSETGALRLYHDANTLLGSSGSPILKLALDVLALHQCGGQQDRGVPIEHIAARLPAK